MSASFLWYNSRACETCGELEPLYEFEGQHVCENCIEDYFETNGLLIPDADNLCNKCGWGRRIYRCGDEQLCLSCILDRFRGV